MTKKSTKCVGLSTAMCYTSQTPFHGTMETVMTLTDWCGHHDYVIFQTKKEILELLNINSVSGACSGIASAYIFSAGV